MSNSHRRLSIQRWSTNGLSFQRCSTNCQGQIFQFTPKTFDPALLHQLSRTGFPIHTEDFRSSAAPPTVKDRFSNSHRRLSFQRCSTNCQGQVLQFTPNTFAPALLHQLSRTGSPIHTEHFRSSAAPPTVEDRFSNTNRRLSFQRCSTNCQGQVLQFTPKTFVPALLHQLSRTGSPIHTEDFRSSAAPPIVKDRFSNSNRRFWLQRCSTNCQGQFRSNAAPRIVKDKFSNSHRRLSAPALLHQPSRTSSPTSHRRLSIQRCSTNCQGQVLHRRLSFQRCSTNCQGQVFQFTPKTFDPALLHQLSKTGSPIRTEDFRSSAAPPTVKDSFSNALRKLSLQRLSINCQGQDLQFTPKTFYPALVHQQSRTSFPIQTEDFRFNAAPPTVKDRFSNSHRRLSFQRCSTNCQGQVFQFTQKTFPPALLHQLSRTVSLQRCSTNGQGQVLQFTPKTFVPALLHKLSRTGSPIRTEDFRSSAAPPTVKEKFSNSHRRLSFQPCSTNCQGNNLQFTPKTFAPALLHELSRTSSPIHTEDFRSSAAPPIVKDMFSNSHRRLSFQRWSTNCQRQILQFTPKTFYPALVHQQTFVPALLHQLSRTGFPIHTEDFRSSAAPPTVKDRFSNSHRRLSFQRCSTNSHRRLSFQRCSTNCQGQVLQLTAKTFAPALLHQLSRTGSPIHTEDFRFSAAPPTVKDKFSNSNRRLSFQRCSTNCQGQVLQFTPKTFVPALLHQLSRTSFPIHTEDFPSSAAPPTFKDSFAPTLLHEWSRTSSPIHTEDFRSSAAPQIVKDRISNSHRRLSLQRCSTNRQGKVLQFTPKTFVPTLLHQLSRK